MENQYSLLTESKHLLWHIFCPAALHGNTWSISLNKQGTPVGCSCDPFLNCPVRNIPHVHGINSVFDDDVEKFLPKDDAREFANADLCASIKLFWRNSRMAEAADVSDIVKKDVRMTHNNNDEATVSVSFFL